MKKFSEIKINKKFKYLVILFAIAVIGLIALVSPQYVESVAKAFMLVIAGV